MKKDLYNDTYIKVSKERGENSYLIVMYDKESDTAFATAILRAKQRKGNMFLCCSILGYGDEWTEYTENELKDTVKIQTIDMFEENNFPQEYIDGFYEGYYMTEWL